VDDDLLCSWLELPPGSWPPDHYTLLSLPADCSTAAVEPRVIQKMDLLRHHQLLHPELVTAGMNRLAQALITLTDPLERKAYDAELGLEPRVAALPNATVPTPIRPPSVPSTSAVIVAQPVLEDFLGDESVAAAGPGTMDLTQEISLPPGVFSQPYELLEEVVPSTVSPTSPRPAETAVEAEVVEGIPIKPAVRPWPTPPSSRRWIYARLAAIRKALRAWHRLRHVFGDPNDPLDRPGRILVLLESAAELRLHLPSLLGLMGIGQPGGLVVTIVNQPLLMDTLRRLLPEQRQRLSIDWRRGNDQLQQEYGRLRRLALQLREEAEGIQRVPFPVRWIRDFPELLLLGLAFITLFFALFRKAVGH